MLSFVNGDRDAMKYLCRCVDQVKMRRVVCRTVGLAFTHISVREFTSASQLLLKDKDHRGASHGTSHRISFDDRVSKRTRSGKDERKNREELEIQAQQFAETGFGQECEAAFADYEARANRATLKVTNPALALEQVLVEIGGGNKKPLAQLATIVKVSKNEIEVTAMSPAHTSAILQRLPRYDPTLSPQKQSDVKIKVMMVHTTREKRMKVADEIGMFKHEFVKKLQHQRNIGINFIKSLELSQDLLNGLVGEIDAIEKQVCEEKSAIFDDMATQVLEGGDSDDEEPEDPK